LLWYPRLGEEVRRPPATQGVSPVHPPLWPAYLVAKARLASPKSHMHDASPNDRPAAPACTPNLTPLLCSQSQWRFLLFPRTSAFSASMTETLTVLSISSAGGWQPSRFPGALLRAFFPSLLQPLLPK